MQNPNSQRAFFRYSAGVLLYNLGVIAWGAYVRATGSGAGCGEHWPTCNGVVIPRDPSVKTLIEFSHRLTSGLALVSTVLLLVWAFRLFEKGSPLRRAAVWTNVFMLGEALIGAGLVLFRLVEKDESITRAVAMGAHLTNTFFLLAAMTLTSFLAGGGRLPKLHGQGMLLTLLGWAFLGMFVLGISGAIAALGDTLFPATSLAQGFAQDLSPVAHLFLKLRGLHPLFAVAEAVLLLATANVAGRLRPSSSVRRQATVLSGVVVLQILAGLTNLVLLAPVWMQLVHLVLADLVWIALSLLAFAALSEPAPQSETPSVPAVAA